jgi:hypothetical protein
VTEAYPLVELGVTKADEDAILIRHGLSHARKSGCAMCPFQPVGWYWALRETDPAGWAAVVAYERVALARNPRMFIVGQAPIGEAVAAWRAKHPRATVEEVLGKTYARCGGGEGRRILPRSAGGRQRSATSRQILPMEGPRPPRSAGGRQGCAGRR